MTLTPKQEAFCHAYIETSNASEAYRRAYNAKNMQPDAIWVAACRLLKNSKVTLRVAELTERAVEKHETTVESIAQELDDAVTKAADAKQFGPVVAALMGKAKLYGLVVNKHENVNELTDEQRERRIQQLMDARDASRAADLARAEPESTRH